MTESDINININRGILLARNIPVALVVGADSFLGSHIVDKLLSKSLQVLAIGSDYGLKENLLKASENKHFHKISDMKDLETDRLDYIIVIPQRALDLRSVLKQFREKKGRILLISSVELYGNSQESLIWLKNLEIEVARVAKDYNLNARILRLGAVFGPRMDFNPLSGQIDPIARLIVQTLKGELQKEISLEFSSRSLYIDDAVDLAIKCIFAGATAQKIFDGVLPAPIKVSEIKQVLLDPIWHESRKFKPTELPPWLTPNLQKTIEFLNWHPKSNLVENLKKTVQYFKDNEIKMPQLEEKMEQETGEKGVDKEWKEEKAKDLEALKGQTPKEKGIKKDKVKKFSYFSTLFLIVVGIFIMYSLIWPVASIGWGVLTFRSQLTSALNNLSKGEFEKSLLAIKGAEIGIEQARSIYYSFESLRKAGVLTPQFETADNLANLASISIASAENTILGIQSLYNSLSSITGESPDSPNDHFLSSKIHLSLADEQLQKAKALTDSDDFKSSLPKLLKARVDSLSERLSEYMKLVQKSRALSTLLPEVVGQGSKSYLVLLQNNSELRPTGGFIGSIAHITFEGGKLKKLEVSDVYAVDGQLKLHVEPPKEIAQDLGQKDYFLRDSNWEPDFPTSARQAEWFYNKETGQRVEGVVALDISAVEDLLKVLGHLDLPDYNEKINHENLFEKSVSHAEAGFFPGSQAKKSFLTSLTQALFNKLFFLPNQNWPAIVASLGKSLEEKHMSIYLDDPTLFSYVVSQKWAQVLPRESKEDSSKLMDLFAPVEANLGANKANYYLDRNYKLETTISKDGEVSHILRIAYTNRSPSNVFPGGDYKNRMRVYLPSGAKLTNLSWGEANILKDVSSFVDFGRSGYSFLLELKAKEQKTLIAEYQLPGKLKFENEKALYRLDIIKQAGTHKDPFEWTIFYPLNMKVRSEVLKVSPQQASVAADLSKDRSFEVEFVQ